MRGGRVKGTITVNQEEIEEAIRVFIENKTGAKTDEVTLVVTPADPKKKQKQTITANAEVIEKEERY